jgi:transcription initiation factor TFIIE subunit beta
MDSALLKEREAFKRRAMAVPTVENKVAKKDGGGKDKKKAALLGAQSESAKAKAELAKKKTTSTSTMGMGSSSYKFGVLAKIVRHMKARHMDAVDHPLNLEELLDETNQLDAGSKIKAWLVAEALKNNPKIDASPAGTYLYKPPYDIMNKKGLLKLLRRQDLKGLGGIFLEDVIESLPKSEKIIRTLTEEAKIITVNRSVDKKKVLFIHDHTSDFNVNEEFQKLWRSVAVDGLDDSKIEEYLDKQGIKSMADNGPKRAPIPKRKRAQGKRKNRAPKDNEHLKDVLEDYDSMTADSNAHAGKK